MIRIIFITIFLASCTSVPTQEMSDARLAVKAAQQANAVQYAPFGLAEAERHLIQAETELADEQSQLARYNAVLAKEHAVTSYKIATAIDCAKNVWRAAIAMAPLSKFDDSLQQAEMAIRQDDFATTLHLAEKACHQGKIALNQAYLDQTDALINRIRATHHLSSKMLPLLETVETAYLHYEGKKAYDLAYQLLDQLF